MRAAALAACALLGACATVKSPALSPAIGYLDTADIARLAQTAPLPAFAPAEPLPGEPGTDRWWLATAHAELRPPWAAQHFDCVLDARLAEAPRPALNRLMARVLADSDSLTRAMAGRAPRERPVATINDLEACQRLNDASRGTRSWPASGAVAGAVYGEMFAALAPDRAAASRRMGREIGESRAICHVNWPSDVAAGALAGEALYATLGHEPEFAADVEAARAEVAAARAEGLTSPACAAERRALRPVAAR